MPPLGIDHVQVAMPRGREVEARGFYGSLLGLSEVPKPPVQAARGGLWFKCGSQELHLGVEEPFSPARKAHPAIVFSEFESLLEQLREAGFSVAEDSTIPGVRRAFVADPFGNRVELVAL
jgi:catechol 2,3-dioxygenase-like lactoylglutathione lyase family enzyme